MNYLLVFWLIFFAMLFTIVFCDLKYNMLRDISTATSKPYSWSRVQLAWWMLIIISAFITIICCTTGHEIPTLNSSTLVLLGITTGTTATATLIDVSDKQNPNITSLSQNQAKENFFLDILSDANGVSIHRLQSVIFNFVFGIWFIDYVLEHFTDPCSALHPAVADCATQSWNYIIPFISTNNLILLGLSSATYAALKTTENAATVPSGTPAGNTANNVNNNNGSGGNNNTTNNSGNTNNIASNSPAPAPAAGSTQPAGETAAPRDPTLF